MEIPTSTSMLLKSAEPAYCHILFATQKSLGQKRQHTNTSLWQVYYHAQEKLANSKRKSALGASLSFTENRKVARRLTREQARIGLFRFKGQGSHVPMGNDARILTNPFAQLRPWWNHRFPQIVLSMKPNVIILHHSQCRRFSGQRG